MKTVSVQVTQANIFGGTRGACKECVLALAINPHLRAGLRASIGYDFRTAHYLCCIQNFHGIVLTEEKPLPHAASLLAQKFDDGETVEPINFEIELPEEVLR